MSGRLSNIRTATALVTPFVGGRVDRTELNAALDRQVNAGMDAVVVCDVIGEGYALSDDERDLAISTCVERADGRLAVIAATGTYGTERSITLTARVQQLGVDGLLVTVPYYSKPTRAGVAAHFRSIAEVTHLPIIIDDEPHRTAIEAGSALLFALMDVFNIVGIRHGAGRLGVFSHLEPVLRRRYHHYCGDDIDLPAFIACGGHGVISSFGNLFPSRQVAVGRSVPGAVEQWQQDIASILSATGNLWGAAVIKAACAALHGGSCAVRLPLVEVDQDMAQALGLVMPRLATSVKKGREAAVALNGSPAAQF